MNKPRKHPLLRQRRLSPKQSRFCIEYLQDLNGTQAAIRAGYSAKTAKVIANQLLAKTLLQDEIARLTQERNERLKIDADWVLRRLVDEANANLKDLFASDGSLKPVEEWPEIWRLGLVSGIEIREIWGRDKDGNRVQIGVTKKLKLADRIRRIELIGKHVDVQAFKERASVSTDDPLKKLFEQIAGHAIRPCEEDEDSGDEEPLPSIGDRMKH